MAGQSITFDFLSRGAASLSRDFRSIGDDSALSSRGVRVLSDVIERLGAKEDRTAAESKLLAGALRQTGEAADRATAKAVLADAAIRRLGDDMKNVKPADVVVLTDKAAAKLTEIKAKAEELKARFPQYTVQINDKIAKAELDLFAAEAKRKLGGLDKQIAGTGTALSGLKLNPGLVGPLLALVPALGTLTGVAAGVGVGLAGAFVAGGGAIAAFGAVAKPVLSDAMKASQAVEKAQNNYAIAIANGTKQSVAYKAEQLAIAKAYANLSPAQIALSQQLGQMAKSWDAVKTAQTPVVAGALQPWLKSVTDLTKNLAPIIGAVSPVIKALGVQFDSLVNSSAFKGFRDFIAGTGSRVVGAAGSTIIDLVKSFMILLPKFNPLILQMTGGIAAIGPAVLKWASSQKTADQITAFMGWFAKNGPVVGGLLTNIAGALKALAPGLTSGGAVELKVISDFFGLVAKLPASFAKPLTEVAGTLLVLSRLGVLKVGVQVVGAAAKWLTGGLVNLGGGAAAGAEIRAAMVSGGAAAAAEIRAAMAGGGAAAAAGGAAGGAAKGAAAGGIAAAGAAAGVVVAGAFAGALIRAVGDTLSPAGTFAGKLNQMFQRLNPVVSASTLHAFTFGGLEAWVTAKIGQPVGAALLATGKFIQNTWATIWANTVGGAVNDGKRLVAAITGTYNSVRNFITGSWNQTWAATRNLIDAGLAFLTGSWQKLQGSVTGAYNAVRTSIANAWNAVWANTRAVISAGIGAVAGSWRTLQAGVVSAYSTVRTDIASAWNTIWANTRSAVTTGIAAVVGFFRGLPGRVVSALSSLGGSLLTLGKLVIGELLSGITSAAGSVISYVTSFAGKVIGAIKKIFGIGSPSTVFHEIGVNLVQGLLNGLHARLPALDLKARQIADAAKNALGVPGGGGPASAGAAQAQAYAKSRLGAYGWGQDQWPALQALWTGESGWNRLARNPSSGAYGIPQALPASKMGAAANPPTSSAAAQIDWGMNYIKTTRGYGSPSVTYAKWLARSPHWYDRGGWLPTGLSLAYNATGRPERVLSPGEDTGGGLAGLAAELRALRAEVRRGNDITAAIPAATGAHVGGAISGAAGAAGFRNRYTRGGA